MRSVRLPTIVAAVLLVSAFASAGTPSQLLITIESESPYFSPPSATVTTGTPIRWYNPTATEHTITHDGCTTDGPCAFDSEMMLPLGRYTVPSLPPGRYPYHCRVHPIMRGILTVTEPAAPAQT